MINFVSNLPEGLRSGGFSAMSAAACAALRRRMPVHYVGPVDPPAVLWQKVVSKAMRVTGAPGDFFFFSERRLEAIAQSVAARAARDAALDFFHGFTPWIRTRPARPYVAWSDCTFADYIRIFHDRARFRSADLERIERAESEWLRGARAVLFTTEWGAARSVAHYGLDPARVGTAGLFGEIDAPARDTYAGGRAFVFVSTHFAAKGGHVVLAALRDVRREHADVTLDVVGDCPVELQREPGVRAHGYLRKEVAAEAQAFAALLAGARAFVNATTRDIGPLSIVEAALFGTPAISARRFAIPELVDDGRTGWLVDDPARPDLVAAAMRAMLADDAGYARMRAAAWTKARAQFSKPAFEARLGGCVERALAGGAVEPVSKAA
jgi:glycosyltransferase involved in cell wall biosynthesis